MTTHRPTRRGFLVLTAGTALGVGTLGAAAGRAGLLEQGLERLGDAAGGNGETQGLSTAQVVRGLKDALKVGTERVIEHIGRPGGYLDDPAIHIPLPGYLRDAQRWLERAGAAGLLDDLETRMNRAAEAAAPHARKIFFDAIGEMRMSDAQAILDGPDDAATRYFQRTMTPALKDTVRPIIDRELAEAGAMKTFRSVTERYGSIPFAPALGNHAKARLVDHATDGAITGIFHKLAQEEARIRKQPAARTTNLLREVFG